MGKATLSLSTNVFAPNDLADCLACAARLGLSGVEVGPRNAQQLYESEEERRLARAVFERWNLRPHSVHAWTGTDGLPDVCPFTAAVGGRVIVVHCPDKEIESDFAGRVALLRTWDAWCRDRNIVLTVENASQQRLAVFARLFDALPALRLTLDIKHAYKPETLGTTHEDFLGVLAPRLANIHISGIDRAREALGDGCPPGRDAVDWRKLADTLLQTDYAGLITIELSLPLWMDETEREPLYPDLPLATPEEPTLAHRLAGHGVRYFRKQLAAALPSLT